MEENPTFARGLATMAHKPDPKLALRTFGTGRRCRLCKCHLSQYNPERYCASCERELGGAGDWRMG
jgi:hypothetical protein